MKKIFISLILLFTVEAAQSQGNLQFNRVMNIVTGTNYTVPAGKVLKIESINQNSAFTQHSYNSCTLNAPQLGLQSGVTCYYNDVLYLKIGSAISYTQGGGTTYINTGGGCAACPSTKNINLTLPNFNYPIWVPEGQEIKVFVNNVVVSALEFNIVQ